MCVCVCSMTAFLPFDHHTKIQNNEFVRKIMTLKIHQTTIYYSMHHYRLFLLINLI